MIFPNALKSDGTVWAWGWNFSGQLGDGTLTDSSIPVQVSGSSGIYQKAIMETGGEQVASNNGDQHSSGFGCGSIDIDGHGPKGPGDPGGMAALLAMLSLPFIFRLLRRRLFI